MISYSFDDVAKAELLSVEEAVELPQWILANGDWWWLRSRGWYWCCAATVLNGGSVDRNGDYVYCDLFHVRPALTIPNIDSLEIGETVKVGDSLAQYIGNNKVLLCESIGQHRFDAESTDYEQSEVKQFVDEWMEERRTEA